MFSRSIEIAASLTIIELRERAKKEKQGLQQTQCHRVVKDLAQVAEHEKPVTQL